VNGYLKCSLKKEKNGLDMVSTLVYGIIINGKNMKEALEIYQP